jgi:ATP-dependent RNA helicase DDX23/PRP28
MRDGVLIDFVLSPSSLSFASLLRLSCVSLPPLALPRPHSPSARSARSARSRSHADSLERRRAARSGIDDRHWTEKPLAEMRDRDWRIFREDFSIAARGGSIPHPLRSWRESGIPPAMLDIIDEIGYKEPSPIQRQAIPIGLSYRDLIGIAQTGSGKTAAFVIPMLEYISHMDGLNDENRHLGPYALILAPTRELAQQIESETKRFAVPLGYTTVSIVGGRSVEEQQFNLRNGAEIIIATPGRLKDLIDRNILVLSQCRYVVMDEADRMVDLGFEQDLTFILNAMPEDYEKPQGFVEDVKEGPATDPEAATAPQGEKGWKGHRVTTLFSATMPPIVERLAKQYLRRPATVVIGNVGEAVDSVEQRVEFVSGEEKKKARLQELLRTLGLPPPMIVFVNEKKTADMVVRYVQGAGKRATTLHSGKNQEQREAALQALRDGDVEVLVATDLVSLCADSYTAANRRPRPVVVSMYPTSPASSTGKCHRRSRNTSIVSDEQVVPVKPVSQSPSSGRRMKRRCMISSRVCLASSHDDRADTCCRTRTEPIVNGAERT